MKSFSARLLAWFDQHGRTDLPWQHPRTPYRVWLSEVMLQQTQVSTAMPYFERFVATLPELESLAAASIDDVLALWSGLGYYNRARNLQRAARICVERHGGKLPSTFTDLVALPGIGRSTAGAILAQAFGQRRAILDGNVRRVLARWRGIRGITSTADVQRRLWHYAERLTPRARVADYTQAIMDLGAGVCTRGQPRCDECPLSRDCVARTEGLTAELPQTGYPKARRPMRRTTMLIVQDEAGRVLLERRPAIGVWAQLWSLPESADAGSTLSSLSDRHGLRAQAPSKLPQFVHTFSHFHLEVVPLLFKTVRAPSTIGDTVDCGWFARDELEAIGLPSPVRKLLNRVLPAARV
ncbi:MAG: A/G-specific adenine glycosylase [Rhodanobacteraceae bacterium]